MVFFFSPSGIAVAALGCSTQKLISVWCFTSLPLKLSLRRRKKINIYWKCSSETFPATHFFIFYAAHIILYTFCQKWFSTTQPLVDNIDWEQRWAGALLEGEHCAVVIQHSFTWFPSGTGCYVVAWSSTSRERGHNQNDVALAVD